tara:strand:- start:84 stop:224 length:141 start_codon:yes stop_codon:yes gene_type:complete
MDTLKEKLKAYESQKEQAKELYIQAIGAIKVLKDLIEEDKSETKKK